MNVPTSPLKPRKMEIDDKLKAELHLHTLAMEEQQKTRARLLGESDDFNHIIEMNAEVERRKIAAMAMQGMLSNSEIIIQALTNKEKKDLAREVVSIADALIAELNKKKDGK